MPKKIMRTQSERFEIIAEIISFIGVGDHKKTSINQIVEYLSSEHQQEKSYGAFKKEIERLCNKMHADFYDEEDSSGLVKISENGKSTTFYWSDNDEKSTCIDRFTITKPRAFALQFAKQHISQILPSAFFSALEQDFKEAQKKLEKDGIQLDKVLDYAPFGLTNLEWEHRTNFENEASINLIFDAIISKIPIKFKYNSIHADYKANNIVISPQKLRYLSGQVQVLGYDHDKSSLKHFALMKMSDAQFDETTSFKQLDLSQFESSHQLKVRCHTWVKDFLMTANLGATPTVRRFSDDVWEITTPVMVPNHFLDERPDGFYISNFLSMFGDSLQVISPEFVKQEMARRSRRQVELYEDKTTIENIEKLITQSPSEMSQPATQWAENGTVSLANE